MDKKILVTESSLPPFAEYIEKIRAIWETKWLTNSGPIHEELECSMKEFLSCDNVELFVNGHMALDVAIKALELTGEVITTPFSFASTTHAIVMNGLVPVFCDIKPNSYTIDEKKVEALITENTSAILAVHVYGVPCDLEELQKIADRYHLKLIYDAAHTFGVRVDGRSLATYGDISMLSFHATKVFNSIEGGALIFRDLHLQKRLKALRNFGIEGPESITSVGLNAKMNEFSAAMGVCNLKHLGENISKRKEAVGVYINLLANVPGLEMLDFDILSQSGVECNYAYFPVVIDEQKAGVTRDNLFLGLQEYNIFARKYFYPLITGYACYREQYGQIELPVARYVADRVITLPLYSEITENEVKRVCDAIKKIISGG